MHNQPQISFRNIGSSISLSRTIHNHIYQLEKYFDRLSSCHVTVEAPHKKHNKGNVYRVNIHFHVPGKEINVTHENEDLNLAILDSFHVAGRRLNEFLDKRFLRLKKIKHIIQNRERKYEQSFDQVGVS